MGRLIVPKLIDQSTWVNRPVGFCMWLLPVAASINHCEHNGSVGGFPLSTQFSSLQLMVGGKKFTPSMAGIRLMSRQNQPIEGYHLILRMLSLAGHGTLPNLFH